MLEIEQAIEERFKKEFKSMSVENLLSDIFRYADNLREYNKQIEDTYEDMLKRKWTLSSVNWIHNNDIVAIYNKEFKQAGFSNRLWDWYYGFVILLTHWLETTMGMWVVKNNIYQILDTISLMREAYNVKETINQDKPNLTDCSLDTIIVSFPNTLEAINRSYLNEENKPFAKFPRNINQEGNKIPMSFIIDPIFLTITFIH